jgi:AcrR family transcriptional regulator
MARRTDSSAAPRTPLSRERVLRAAIVLADAGGIEALSMRRLARALGVEAMSLYNHVANKDAILDGIIDGVAAEIELPAIEAGWRAALRHGAISSRDALVRHRWACSLWLTRGAGPARIRHTDWILGTLRQAGFAKELTYHALHILESYIQGYALQQLNFSAQDEQQAGLATAFLQHFDAGVYPYLTEHIAQHMEPRSGEPGGFEIGLELILDGLERLRDTTASRPAER